jgi:hypothetical protein
MQEIELIQNILSSGADAATVAIAVILIKLERRVHNLELVTGIKRLLSK